MEIKKKAINQLYMKLIELIRVIELGQEVEEPLLVSTDDFDFEIKFTEKTKRFFSLVKGEELKS